MSVKTDERYSFGKKAASSLVVFILVLAFITFYAGSVTIGQTETVASTTYTSTLYSTVTSTETQTSYQYVTVSVTNVTTVNYIGPDSILVSGRASSTGFGNTANAVIFQNENNVTFIAQVNGGAYSISLPNHHFYTVFIRFTSTAGLTSGQCSAGGMSLFYTGTSMTATWRC